MADETPPIARLTITSHLREVSKNGIMCPARQQYYDLYECGCVNDVVECNTHENITLIDGDVVCIRENDFLRNHPIIYLFTYMAGMGKWGSVFIHKEDLPSCFKDTRYESLVVR